MKKTIVYICLIVLIAALVCGALCGCVKKPVRKEHVVTDEQKTVLFLGDSIAEAMAGPSPLTERETYGYYGVLGNINGFSFYNRAVSGDQTKDLYTFIQREDDGVNMVKSLVSTSDVIHISIGGNDLLGHDIGNMIIQAGNDNFETVDDYLNTAYYNLDRIITKIREMNPDAIIILQTQYNPVGKDSPLVSTYAKMRLNSMAYTQNDYHRLAGEIIGRLNDMYRRYLEENENKFEYEPYYLVDVASAFEEIYKASPTRWARLFCPDGIHPANEGHALIVEANQKLLVELGLAAPDALAKYKELRKEQLTRLYDKSVEVSAIKTAIDNCENYSDVTIAYFNAVQGKDINYYHNNNVTPVGTHFEEDKVFDITKLTIRGLDLTKANVSSLSTTVNIMSSQKSYIAFNADGTFEMKYAVVDGLKGALEFLERLGFFSLPLDLSELVDLDINYLQSNFLQHMFPGFDYADLISSLEIVSGSVGFSITGPDFNSREVREMANEMAKTGHLKINSLDVVGDNLGVTWTGTYRLVEQTSALTGEKYTAIYIGEEFYKGETYLRFTYTPSSSGDDEVRLTVDVVDIVVEGKIE